MAKVPYINSNVRRMADRAGYSIEIHPRRSDAWSTPSAKPVHLKHADGSHYAAFTDGRALLKFLLKRGAE